METNFTMETHKQDQDLYIDIKGTFDGASAFALIHEIGDGLYDATKSIHVETNAISKVYPFGRAILAYNMPKRCRNCVYFSGAMAEQIAPEGCPIKDGKLHQTCHKCTGDCKNCSCKKGQKTAMGQPDISIAGHSPQQRLKDLSILPKLSYKQPRADQAYHLPVTGHNKD